MDDDRLQELLEQAAGWLETDFVQEDEPRRWSTDVRFPDGRKQRVFLSVGQGSPHYRHLGPDQRVLFVSSHVGPLRPEVDTTRLLRLNAEATLAAVSVFFAPGSQALEETIYTTAGLPLAVVTPAALVALIDEVAGMADALEEELFGVDER